MTRPCAHVLLVGLLLSALLLGTALPAAAHTYLERSEPGDDETVTEEVTEIVLEFNQAVNQSIAHIEVTAPDGTQVAIGDVSIDGEFVRRAVDPLPVEGEYAVSYRIVASDGHPLEGELSFVYAGPLPEPPPTPAPTPTLTPEPTVEATPTRPSVPAPTPTESDDVMAGGGDTSTPPPVDGTADETVATSPFGEALPRGRLTVAGLVILGLVLAAATAIRGLVRWQPPSDQPSA